MDDNEKRTELLSWVARGVLECLSSTRGAAMFGSKAIAKAVDNSTLEIRTYEEGVSGPIYYELKLRRKV